MTLSYDFDHGFSRSKILKSCIPGMEGPIDMKQKGYESMGSQTYFVTLNLDVTHDLDLGF